MIIKGQTFTFMYETRNKSTGELVADATASATHTIKVIYNDGSTWTSTTLVNGITPDTSLANIASKPVYIGSDNGMYLFQIGNTYTDCEHVIISVTSSNTNVIIPIQQFYPVSTTAIRDAVWNTNNGTRSLSTEPPTASTIASTVWGYSSTRSLTTDPPTATAIANAVWNRNSGTSRQLTTNVLDDSKPTHDELALSGETTSGSGGSENSGDPTTLTKAYIAEAVWNAVPSTYQNNDTMGAYIQSLSSIGSSVTTVDTTALASQVSRLEGYIDTLSTNIGYLSTHTQTITSVATTLFTGTDSLVSAVEDIPKDVWTYTSYSNIANQQPARAIADIVWGRDPGDDDRALTTNVLDAYLSPTLALSTEVDTGTDFDPSSIQFPDKDQIATAVWNYGKASGVANQTGRSLSNTAIVNANGTVSSYIGTLSSSSSTIDTAVWSSNDKTLSSASIDDGDTIATTADIPSIENLTSMLTKIFGVLCHWELDGDNILVKNDAGSTILTIPTTKDKYGDIIRMDGSSEELQ